MTQHSFLIHVFRSSVDMCPYLVRSVVLIDNLFVVIIYTCITTPFRVLFLYDTVFVIFMNTCFGQYNICVKNCNC